LTELGRWLDDRHPAAPRPLRQAILAAVRHGDPGAGTVAERLAAAGLDALARVVAQPSTRPRALELLAADALITYACEAAIEEGGGADALEWLAAAMGMRRFAQLLEEVER
jgi:hypothetical protein